LGEQTTPEIYLLCGRAVTDVQSANRDVKNVWQRTRPFAQFKEPSLKPWEDEEEASLLRTVKRLSRNRVRVTYTKYDVTLVNGKQYGIGVENNV
jgi:hypothetical protein